LWSLVFAAASLLLGAALCKVWQLDGLATAMVIAEGGLALIAARLARQVAFEPSALRSVHAA
jgi:hypothetical protein